MRYLQAQIMDFHLKTCEIYCKSNLNFLVLSDSITKIAFETSDVTDAGSENSLKVKICQKQKCCETPIFPGKYEKGSVSTFSGTDLGDCENESVDMLEPMEATVILPSSTDGYRGNSITIFSVAGQAICPITIWLDNDNINLPHNQLKIDCSVTGRLLALQAF